MIVASRHDEAGALVTGLDTGLRIGGASRPAEDRATIDIVDPATGATFTAVASATVSDAVDAVGVAESVFPAWAVTPPRERAEVLRRAFELMTQRREWLAELIVLENGKVRGDPEAEVAYAAEFFRWYAEEAVRVAGTVATSPSGSATMLVTRQPVGVSVLVTPWNFPAAMATRKIGPALAAGCTVVLKPASETPLTALAIADILAEAGLPDGVVNVVPSSRSAEVVTAMLAHQAVRKLSFTGSTEVGRVLLRQAADRVVNVSMELGGNAPFIVLDDADVDAAVAGAMVAKMRNGGQACTAANRFYVHESVADEFTDGFATAMAAVRLGPGLDEGTGAGPLVTDAARTAIGEAVARAIRQGAQPLCGAGPAAGRGFFYHPTVLGQVAPDADILAVELFGPVAPIVPFQRIDELITMANGTEYGLASYVYTADQRRGMELARALETGMVGLNRPMVSEPAAPFGGVKQSGIGREGGHEGLLEFTELKYVAVEC